MKGQLYRITRDLHLYLGLFISPFVLVFALSVFFLVHAVRPRMAPETSSTRTASGLQIPKDLNVLSGRQLIDALKPVLESAGVHGEVGFVRHMVKGQELIVPVTIPGRETIVRINLASRETTVVTRETGLADALVTLHKAPGPHGPNIRMNWVYMKAWRWLADATAYLILFISASGVYLWSMLRVERSVGMFLLLAGALSLLIMTYALSH